MLLQISIVNHQVKNVQGQDKWVAQCHRQVNMEYPYGQPRLITKLGELVPSARSTLDGSNKIGTKINKNVRILGDKRALENQGEIPATKTMEYVAPKHKAKKKKRVRYTKYDESDDDGERYKRYRRDADTY